MIVDGIRNRVLEPFPAPAMSPNLNFTRRVDKEELEDCGRFRMERVNLIEPGEIMMNPNTKPRIRQSRLVGLLALLAIGLLFLGTGCENHDDDAKDHYRANDVSDTQKQTVFSED